MPQSFGKREREQAKRAKAEAKRRRRHHNPDTDAPAGEPPADVSDASEPDSGSSERVLAQVADLHRRYEDGDVSFEEFEATKAELLAQIVID